MSVNRLLRTSAIRLALRYALLYVLIAGVGLGVLYWATSRYVDTQIAASLRQELAALIGIDRSGGRGRLLHALASRPGLVPENHRFTLLESAAGEKLAGDLNAWPPALAADGRVRNIWIDEELTPAGIGEKEGYWPVIAALLPDGSRLLLAQSIRQAEELQEFILGVLFLTLLAIFGLMLALGWRMGRRMLARVDQVNHTARQILQGNLGGRVPVSGSNDEFDELAANLNAMLEHTDRLVKGMREVTDNVAHDLRRPLTRLVNRLDVILLEKRDGRDYVAVLQEMREDIEGIVQTFNALLEIAQAESGSYRGEWGRVDLSLLTRDLGSLYQDLVEQESQSLQVSVAPGVVVEGNRHLIGQAISNLMENAHKYAGPGAGIVLRLERGDASAQLSVCDNGPGIPADQRQRVRQRFVRLDDARSTPGNGLGLSLVMAVAQLHGSELTMDDNHPGLCVSIKFRTANSD